MFLLRYYTSVRRIVLYCVKCVFCKSVLTVLVLCLIYYLIVGHVQGGIKMLHHFLYALTSPNINRFLKLFHTQNQVYLRFPYLRFPPLRIVLAFSVLAFSMLAKCRVSYLHFPYLRFPVLAISAPPLGSAESQVPKPISRDIIFAEFQRVWSQSTNVTDGRTDRQTDRKLIMAIPCYATLRAVMKNGNKN